MSATEQSGEWPAVQAALERYFLAREQGEAIDVKRACGGDEQLASRVLEVLGGAPDLVVEYGEVGADAEPLSSFGDFDVVEQIGKGGMGTVYLALQRSLGRRVALKVLDRSVLDMPSARLRMRREAELTAHLDHPNIVPVYAVGEVGEVPFIAMKYLLGPSLAEVERPWSPERVAEVGMALANALDTAHVNGVVHRDVKPANILLDGDTPVFVDFGLARAQSDPTLTQEGKVAGTLRYMAPERLDAATPVLDPRVDIYGLGATLYELLAAREVFAEQSPTALVRSVLARDPAPLRLTGRHHDLETIVLRALAKEPRRRFATAREMAEDLGRYLRGEPVLSRRMSRVARTWRVVQRYPRSSGLLAVAAVLVLASLGVLFAMSQNEAADRARRVEAAQVDLRDHRHQRALGSLQLLAERHPADAEVRALLAKARAELAIDRLLVLAADPWSGVPADIVIGLSTPDEPVIVLASVLALHQGGDREGARARLHSLPPATADGRAARAITSWLANTPLPWSLPPVDEHAGADEALFASLALRLAGATPDRVLQELHSSAVADRDSPRSLFLEAILRVDLGQLVEANSLLRGLARDEAPAPIWRWLANVQVKLGQLDEAAVSLRRARDDRSPAADYLRLQHAFAVATRGGDLAARDELIAGLRAQNELSTEAQRFLAEYDGKSDVQAVPDAMARLEDLLVSGSLGRSSRDLTLAALIEIAGWHLPGLVLPRDVEPAPERHRELLAKWQERASQIRYPNARVVADMWIARSLCCSAQPGAFARGLDLFRDTCEVFPGHAAVALRYAKAATGLPSGTPSAIRVTHGIAAGRAVDDVLAKAASGQCVLSARQARELRYYGWFAAVRTGDVIEMVRRLPLVEQDVPESMRHRIGEVQQMAETAVQAFRRQ